MAPLKSEHLSFPNMETRSRKSNYKVVHDTFISVFIDKVMLFNINSAFLFMGIQNYTCSNINNNIQCTCTCA